MVFLSLAVAFLNCLFAASTACLAVGFGPERFLPDISRKLVLGLGVRPSFSKTFLCSFSADSQRDLTNSWLSADLSEEELHPSKPGGTVGCRIHSMLKVHSMDCATMLGVTTDIVLR